MHWTFDIDTRKLTDPVTGLGVGSTRMALPDKYPVTIDVKRGAAAHTFSGSVVLVLRTLNGQAKPELAKATISVTGAATATGTFSLATTNLNNWLPAFGDRPATLEVLLLETGSSEVASLPVSVLVGRRYGDTSSTELETLADDTSELFGDAGIELS